MKEKNESEGKKKIVGYAEIYNHYIRINNSYQQNEA